MIGSLRTAGAPPTSGAGLTGGGDPPTGGGPASSGDRLTSGTRPAAGSRRELLRQAAIGAAALSASAVLLRPPSALAQSTDDEDLRDYLEQAIALEQAAVLGYSIAAESDRLPAALREPVERFGAQEEAHAEALRSAIDQLGFDPPPAPDSAADTEAFEPLDEAVTQRLTELLESLEQAGGDTRLVEALIGLETEQLRFYLGEAPALDSVDLVRTSAEIAGCQAQHLVVLREQRGGTPAEAASIPVPE